MTITFVGHGYVGLVSAAIFADMGNTVHVIGHTEEKIENLKRGIIPIFEPGLAEIVKRNVDAKRLLFTLDYNPAIQESQAVFIAVGTPPLPTGEADLSVVFDVAEKIGQHLDGYTVIATKSTVPVGTNAKVKEIIEKSIPQGAEFDVASCPEFLREGTAIEDTLHPDRVVIGTETKRAEDVMLELHEPFKTEIVTTNLETAELIKYASNSFLATKISFSNAIAKLAEATGADAIEALRGVGLDKRIGSRFLQPGAGYGGSCFPKDVKALIAIARANNYEFELLNEVERINKEAREDIVRKAEKMLDGDVSGKKIGVLGLAFKPDTDDMRDAPAVDVINSLTEKGAQVKAYDPEAQENAKGIIKNIEFANDAYDTVTGADLVILMTEWNEFKEMDLEKVKGLVNKPALLDSRNVFTPVEMENKGFAYMGVGR